MTRKAPPSTVVARPARARSRGFSVGSCRALTISAVLLGAAACGPDGRSVGDTCPDLPLYRFQFDEATGAWTRVKPGDGGVPLDPDEIAKIESAEEHCTTPAGNATGGFTTPPDAGAP